MPISQHKRKSSKSKSRKTKTSSKRNYRSYRNKKTRSNVSIMRGGTHITCDELEIEKFYRNSKTMVETLEFVELKSKEYTQNYGTHGNDLTFIKPDKTTFTINAPWTDVFEQRDIGLSRV